MKKINDRGFMLTETLIVATFLVTTLLFIYVQFNKITKTYDTSFKYNTINGLYAANNIKKYISNDGIANLKNALAGESVDFVSISDCSNTYFKEVEYCQVLMNNSNIKTALFTKENLASLKSNTNGLDQTMIDFINYINDDGTSDYRIIIEFKDNTFASIKIEK